ncbi:MAG: flagellin [Lachnospiraceae bacterium]|nr:flagellin [Lachnospiraceae bacterium]
MVVQHNMQAANANRMLGITTSAQSKSAEKLSSGYKINRAADDAAGLAISEKMRSQVRGLDRASTNAQDGVSVVQTAEGALNEVHSMLQRMNELATQAANDTNTTQDRSQIQLEVDQLTSEINRVSSTTQFNTMNLLDGNFTGKNLQVGSLSGQKIEISIGKMSSAGIGAYDGIKDVTGTATDNTAKGKTLTYFSEASYTKKDGSTGTLDAGWYEKDAHDSFLKQPVKPDGTANTAPTKADIGGLTIDGNAMDGNSITTDTTGKVIGIGNSVRVDSFEHAGSSMKKIQDAIDSVSTQRATLGAVQNRLEHTIANLDNVSENTQSAESRIRDTDMAKEMVQYSKNNILAQAGQSMLAQANQSNQGVLSLLQ